MQTAPQKKPQAQAGGDRKEKQVQTDPALAAEVKETAKFVQGVKDCTAVVVNQNISAAIKVTGFDRFKLKSIKEKVHNKIKTLGQNYEVHVTSDKKLFKELQQIEKQIKEQQKVQDLQQKVEKINKDMQE